MTEKTKEPTESELAYKRVADRLEGHFVGVGEGVGTPTSRLTESLLVELLVCELRIGDGGRSPESYPWVDRPIHLPTDDTELKCLHTSDAKSDTTLKLDIARWRDDNAVVANKRAAMLKVPIEAYRRSMELAETSTSDIERAKYDAWTKEIVEHLARVWRVNPEDVSKLHVSKLHDWACDRFMKVSPVPKWLRKSGGSFRAHVDPRRTWHDRDDDEERDDER